MLLLSEAMSRLEWCAFFDRYGTKDYTPALFSLNLLKDHVAEKNWKEGKASLESFIKCSGRLMSDYQAFIEAQMAQSETFQYWHKYIELVNLIRSDREGNWDLHLDTVQALLPLFAVFDCTNYLRWCSLYLEDMRMLPQTAPNIYSKFIEGKFVVKRKEG